MSLSSAFDNGRRRQVASCAMTVGERLQAARASVGLSRRALAGRIDPAARLGYEVIGKIERDDPGRPLKRHEAEVIAPLCNTTADYLLDGEGELRGGLPPAPTPQAVADAVVSLSAQLAEVRAEVAALRADLRVGLDALQASVRDLAADRKRQGRSA